MEEVTEALPKMNTTVVFQKGRQTLRRDGPVSMEEMHNMRDYMIGITLKVNRSRTGSVIKMRDEDVKNAKVVNHGESYLVRAFSKTFTTSGYANVVFSVDEFQD